MKKCRYFTVLGIVLFFLLTAIHIHTVFATTFTVPTNGMQAYTQQFIADINEVTPSITLEWPSYTGSANLTYNIFRKATSTTAWGSSVSGILSSTTYTWADTNIEEGEVYEYQLQGASYGYILSGYKVQTPFSRGKVILLIESSIASPLGTEIDRLKKDLVGDGWQVEELSVSSSTSVSSVKSQIVSLYNEDPSNTKALFIIGHVAVPYSGNMALDGHYPDHEGAWATDTFYADMDGTWTDSVVNKTAATYDRTDNIPGDGKYDQFFLPSNPELSVGRVDLYNMPAFGLSEVELLRRYLDKDHNYRQRVFEPRRVGLMGDNFGTSVYTSQTAWNNMTALLGPTDIENRGSSYFTYVSSSSLTYLMTYGNGGGTYTSASGVGSTANYAGGTTYGVFNSHFGSYFGDWDNQNNFLKASIAGAGYGLTNMWGGWPAYHLHQMALGGTIGESIVLTQKNGPTNDSYRPTRPGYNSIVINLMGDPTLRMFMVDPPSNVQAVDNGGGDIDLSWDQSGDDVLGYYVLRSEDEYGPYELATTTRISGTTYSESLPTGTYHYMVRAELLEETPSGSFYNKSQGSFTSSALSVTNDAPTVDAGEDLSIEFLSDPINLLASVNDDGGAEGISVAWSVLTGPEVSYEVAFSATTSTSTSVYVSDIGNYVFRITASDGISSVSDDISVVVEDEYDMSAPETPTGLDLDVISDTQINLQWSAPIDNGTGSGTPTGVSGYLVFRDESNIATTTQAEYQDTGLTQNTEYEYYIIAFDYNNNLSSSSDSVSATTEHTPTNPSVTTGSASSISRTSAVLAGTITSDGYGIVTEVGFIYSTSTNSTTTPDQFVSDTGSFDEGSFSVNLSGLLCNTTYYITAYAVNDIGSGYGFQNSFTTSACETSSGSSGGSSSSGSGSRSGGGGGSRTTTTTVIATTASTTATTTATSSVVATTTLSNAITTILCPVGFICTPIGPTTISPLPQLGVVANSGAGQGINGSSFTRSLTVGATGDDVMSLQKYLNAIGFVIANSGPGSPGNETSFFGGLTRSALARFQSANGISPAIGFFGPITRAFVLSQIAQ